MTIWQSLLESLKWLVAGKEMQELQQRRRQLSVYKSQFYDFGNIRIILENMDAEFKGKESFPAYALRARLIGLRKIKTTNGKLQ